jgi:MFS family permease
MAWSGIWVGGNSMVLGISNEGSRGRWMGFYQFSFFLGAASGAIIGGSLTDILGFHKAMQVSAILTLIGALIALIFLPETRVQAPVPEIEPTKTRMRPHKPNRSLSSYFILAALLFGVNRLVIPGILTSTLGIYLLHQFGDQTMIAGRSFGIATLTGIALGLSTIIAMLSTLIAGWLSDHARNRWQSVVGGLLPGILGFIGLFFGLPATITLGIPLVAITSGSNQSLSTILIGDLGDRRVHGKQLGILFTAGDLMSAVGPPLAYALINYVEINVLYLFCAGCFAIVLCVILGGTTKR